MGASSGSYKGTLDEVVIYDRALTADEIAAIYRSEAQDITPTNRGDVNCDGSVNIGDAVLLFNHVSYPNDPTYDLCSDWAGDVNCDGSVNIGDAVLLFNHVSYPNDPTYDLCSDNKNVLAEIEEPVLSDNYFLLNSYPNPFSSTVTIDYTLPETGNVSIKIYNIAGQLVSTLVNEQKLVGQHSLQWNANNNSGNKVPVGTYFYRVVAGEQHTQTGKMLLIK